MVVRVLCCLSLSPSCLFMLLLSTTFRSTSFTTFRGFLSGECLLIQFIFTSKEGDSVAIRQHYPTNINTCYQHLRYPYDIPLLRGHTTSYTTCQHLILSWLLYKLFSFAQRLSSEHDSNLGYHPLGLLFILMLLLMAISSR